MTEEALINMELYLTLESDNTLFHYTKISTLIEKILPNMELLFSPFSRTNDPYEYKKVQFNFTSESHIGVKHSKEEFDYIQLLINDYWKNKFKVICFTKNVNEENIVNGYSKSRMWSQYGDDNKGVCLVFDKNELEKSVQDIYINEEEKIVTGSVYYQNEYGMRNSSRNVDISNLNKYGPERIAFNHLKNYYEELFLTKNSDYRDENEYRIIVMMQREIQLFLSITNSLKGIILGDNCSMGYYPIFKQFMKEKNIFVKKLFWSDWRPCIRDLTEKV